jgi:RNA polymerase sigma-70 factor (ECF subfamily)
MRCRRPTVPLEYVPNAATCNEPEQFAMAGDRNRRLREAVDLLPEHYRLVMMMFYFDELSVEQVSRALDVSISAVKVRLHRGRERLAAKLGPGF